MADYTNSTLDAARAAKDTAAHRVLPPDEVACVSCPSAVWVFVDRTATAKKNAMRQADKPAWRCYCPGLHQWTYDDFSGQPDPECWIFACSLKDQALLELEAPAGGDEH